MSSGNSAIELQRRPMNFEEFCEHIAEAKSEKPHFFDVDRVLPPSTKMIADVEERLGVSFPEEYLLAVTLLGGGQIGYGSLFVPASDEHWSILHRNADHEIDQFVVISDNGCGDLYGFQTSEQGRCCSGVCLVDHELLSQTPTPAYSNLYVFIVEVFFRKPRDP